MTPRVRARPDARAWSVFARPAAPAILAALACGGLFAQAAVVRPGHPSLTQGAVSVRLPVAGGAWREDLERTRALLEEGNLEDAFTALRRLRGQGARALVPAEPGRYMAVDLLADAMLLSLSPAQRRAFTDFFLELSLRAEAAWKAGEPGARDALAREFTVTPAGLRALEAEADGLFEAGAFGAAVEKWRLLAQLGDTASAELAYRMGVACLLSGDEDGLLEAIGRLGSVPGGAELRRAFLAWKDEGGRPRLRGQPRDASAFAHGGRLPPPAPFTEGGIAWRTTRGLWASAAADRFDPVSHDAMDRHAVVFDGVVYVPDGDARVWLVDLAWGKVFGTLEHARRGRAGFVRFEHVARAPQAILADRDLVAVTCVTRLDDARYFQGYAITVPIPQRVLFVHSRRDRELLWRSDGVPGLETFSVVGTPVLRDGILYVPGWVKDGFINVYVCALDAARGTLLWQRLVCGSQLETTIFGEMLREPFGVTLAASGRELFVLTHMGAIGALRACDGVIRWLTTYDTIPVPVQLGSYSPAVRPVAWADNPIVIHGDALCVAPRDAASLLRVSARTGEILAACRVTQATRHLLGIAGGAVLCAGQRGLDAVAWEDFRMRPLVRLGPGDMLQGRPALTEQGVYFCVVGAAPGLYFHSFATGARTRVAAGEGHDAPFEGGNVTVAGTRVLVTSDGAVTAYVDAVEGAP